MKSDNVLLKVADMSYLTLRKIVFIQKHLRQTICNSIVNFHVGALGVGYPLAEPLNLNVLPISSEGGVLRYVNDSLNAFIKVFGDENINLRRQL